MMTITMMMKMGSDITSRYMFCKRGRFYFFLSRGSIVFLGAFWMKGNGREFSFRK
jgi:hypothetical protein